ncbi:TPA: metallophosphoesterase family protein [Candidatus Woesearchaeota archaeon]|nr:metallophosphoesterase family protein [Candidatus Woesearchaeota archaeon]
MRTAIISDIHGNIFAADAVLADIRDQSIDRIFCLGDTVGYLPFPRECLDFVIRNCKIVLRGNHEDWIIRNELDNFSDVAYDSAIFTRKELEPHDDLSVERRRWQFMHTLPYSYTEDEALYVHASPRPNLLVSEYLAADDGEQELSSGSPIDLALMLLGKKGIKFCFHGHTHVAGIMYHDKKKDKLIFLPEKNVILPIRLGEHAPYLIDVGSVGMPRDFNPAACYVIFDSDKQKIEFRRIAYNPLPMQYAIRNTPQINEILAERVKYGT